MAIALIFPGQGAQVVGMAADLCARSPLAKQVFDQASEVLGYDLLKLCTHGPADELNRTEFCQPALFVHSYAALKQLESERASLWDDVSHVAGLSLGEYTAVAASGGMSFEAGVALVQARGRAMQAAAELVPSGMSSVLGLEMEKLQAICKEATRADPSSEQLVRIANLLCPGNIAISGHIPPLQRAEELATAAGAMKAIRLQVAGAFHTPLMQSAVAVLEQALEAVAFKPTRVPVISNVDAQPHTQPIDFKRLLPQQVVSPVCWEDSLRLMLEAGVEQFIEIGTGRILAGTLKRINRKVPCESFGD